MCTLWGREKPKPVKKNLVFVHGFNVKDKGKGTLDKIKHYLAADFEVLQADYGWLGLLGVRLFNTNVASIISGMTPQGSIGIGHSNGCAILSESCEIGAKFDHLILVNPALDRDFKFHESVKRIDVIYNSFDKTVLTASYFPWHRWGRMGQTGYIGEEDSRVYNWNSFDLFGNKGHSTVFENPEQLVNLLRYDIELGYESW